MSRYLIHEHSQYSNSTDNYWIYSDRSEAITNYREFVENAIAGRYLNFGWYRKCYEMENNCSVENDSEIAECVSWTHESLRNIEPENPFKTLYLDEGDYVVFTDISSGGHGGRRH